MARWKHRDSKGRFATMEKSVKSRRRTRAERGISPSQAKWQRKSRRKSKDIYSTSGGLKSSTKITGTKIG